MNHVHVAVLFEDEVILASGVAKSTAIDLRNSTPMGMFSLAATLSGLGTGKWTYESGQTETGSFIEPEDAVDIKDAQTVGQILKSFEPELTPFIKIVCTETGGVNPITIDEANLNHQ